MTVRSTRPSYEYCLSLKNVEPIAELKAVGTPAIKESACLEAGHFDWAVRYHGEIGESVHISYSNWVL